ncbi:phage major capsid protein [Sphingobium sp. V4]|uniref:phage major capsid protein n=1 Tax=Sphingobium sp. V4 TaxID=3038927 RepID=UPI002557F584|nr:phage major capsid protein [Sphingobium sp. V4]WIW88969.1 phage major capsid protein [Sphingobium sp. V4]
MKKLFFVGALRGALGAMTRNERRLGRYLRDGDGHPTDVKSLAEKIKKDFDAKFDKVKEIAEDAVGKAKTGEDLTKAAKELADEAITGMNEVKHRLDDMEQKLDRQKGDGDKAPTSIGSQFVADERVKAFLSGEGKRGKVDFTTKANLTSATTGAGGLGDAVNQTRLPGIIAPPDRRMTVRDLITPGRMDGNTLEYVKETGFTNNAAPVAEGAAKPQSDITFDLVSTTAKVIAHYAKASRQIMDDVSQLESYINGRLNYGLAYREELQILNGDGTGQNLLGIIPQATAYSAPVTIAGATSIDNVRLAMLQAALAEYPASGTVMHPIDWTVIELTKDAAGGYIFANPAQLTGPVLWGNPVVATQAIAQDKFLTGAFKLGAQYFDRWLARIEIATENEDDFIKNMITILNEERGALAVYRPEAFIYGDFGRIA